MDPIVYIQVSSLSTSLVNFLGEPGAIYTDTKTGKLIGYHYHLNSIAIEKIKKRFGNCFEVLK